VDLKHGASSLALTLAVGTVLGASGTWLLLSKNLKQQQSVPTPPITPTSSELATAGRNSSSATHDSAKRAEDRKAFNAEKERFQRTDPKRFKQAQTGLLLTAQISLGRLAMVHGSPVSRMRKPPRPSVNISM